MLFVPLWRMHHQLLTLGKSLLCMVKHSHLLKRNGEVPKFVHTWRIQWCLCSVWGCVKWFASAQKTHCSGLLST